MTIETYQTGSAPAVLQPAPLPAGIATLRAWASVATEAAQLVRPLIGTAFVPEVFRPRIDPRATDEQKREAVETAVATATAAVLYGAGLGLDPLQALSSIHVVKGKPGLYAETMVALLKGAGHETWVEDESDHRVRVAGRRRGSDIIERAEFTIERATKAGYVGQNAKYKTDPRAMLYARAISILCRRLAPEVLKGVASVEETHDEPDGTAPVARQRSVQRAPRTDAVAELTAPPAAPRAAAGPPLPGEDATNSSGQLDERQWRAINARFVELEVIGDGQKANRLRVISAIVGRPVERGGDLTAAEGQLVLDNLAGNSGFTVVGQALSGGSTSAAQPDPAGPPLPGEGDDQDDVTVEDDDPTMADDWGMDGAEAAAEGNL